MTSVSTLIEAYEKMLIIRFAEETIAKDFLDNKIFSFYHSSIGQEAAAVGVCMALTEQDRVFGNHRSHGHYLAKGGDLYRMFCEIYGKADGCCKGKGGSMHMLDRSVGFMGSTPILGSAVSIATGSAFEQAISGKSAITVAFTGDGASEEGVVYESINIAALKNLPIIYVIEDNLYAVNTPHSARRSPFFSARMVYEGLGAEYVYTDGSIFDGTYEMTLHARNLALRGFPVVLHISTYRHMAHSGPIKDESARGVDTASFREQHDPITLLEGILPQRDTARIRGNVAAAVHAAWRSAKACAEPEPCTASDGVYV